LLLWPTVREGKKMKKKDMTIDDILHWIVVNSEDIDSMDKINKVTFPFTSKFKKYVVGE
jgi:hypothetical protein